MIREGHVVLPAGATEVTPEISVHEDRGALTALYPNTDTSTDGFYPLPCEPSIGGSLPPEVDSPPSAGETEAAAYVTAFENSAAASDIVDRLSNIGVALPPGLHGLDAFEMASCGFIAPNTKSSAISCDDPAFLISGQPFEGRDIIYVHGLATEHLGKWLANDSAARRKWPGDAGEFLNSNGYFRVFAEKYWKGHIRENLYHPTIPLHLYAGYEWTASQSGPSYRPKSNRYLLVSWSSNQTLEYAQHTLLTQIMLAMVYNQNVVTPPTYPKNFGKPFCANGCIVITHSTGSEIVSTAMARAARGDFGTSAKLIPRHMRAHISFEGAISGSRLASVGMAIGTTNAPSAGASAVICPIEDLLFDTTNTCALSTAFVANTILRDLIPAVAQGVWGPLIAQTPVPTVTIAGGHPTGIADDITKFLLPGLDDGVVSMNSACGNPWLVTPGPRAPSGVVVSSLIKAYDLGIPPARAIKLFISQKDFQAPPPAHPYMAAGCTPHRSTTGMVMPVASALSGSLYDARRRYPNHFSFLQGALDHAHDGGGDPSNPWPSTGNQPATVPRSYRPTFGLENAEETSAVTNAAIYAQAADGTYLVHPSFASQMYEEVRGKKIEFKLFGKKRTWWIWKRTYHLLRNWEGKSTTHFAYEYVARR